MLRIADGLGSGEEGDSMFKTILVPVDGSELAESALAYAARIAAPVDGNVILLRAEALIMRRRPSFVSADPRSTTWLVPADPRARVTLEAAAARVQADGVATEVDFQRYLRGGAVAAETILDAVCEQRPDLVVMSTHGRSGPARWCYGSVADRIVRGADVPVLLVPATVERPWPFDRALRILAPLDGSPHAEEILEPAAQMATSSAPNCICYGPSSPSAWVSGRMILRPPDRSAQADLSGRKPTLPTSSNGFDGWTGP